MSLRADEIISSAGRKHLRFQLMPDVGPIRMRNLVAHFGSLDAVLSVSRRELERVDGIGPRLAETIATSRGEDAVDQEIGRAAACGVRILCGEDAEYPRPLLNIPDPPICLYVRGRLEPTDAVAVAIVGTRRCSYYGREQAVSFGEALGRAGFTVVSGLARGVDGHAHRGALQAGGRTIAVLGNGLPSIYPPEHEALAADIALCGAVVSESPIHAAPAPESFPRRNRIIVGLALGVIVVEAGKRSGALITARLASEYNREVFALPGRVDQPEMTEGSNGLIRKGEAKLVTCLADILDELGEVGEVMRRERTSAAVSTTLPLPVQQTPVETGSDEDRILQAVQQGVEEPDRLREIVGLEAGRVLSLLTTLELKGLIARIPGNRFVRRNATR